jgi:hypothetical protein
MNYVIARPWHPDDPNSDLCIYAYGNEVHQGGTLKQARELLAYVRRQEPGEAYAIYEVTFKRL